MKIFLSDLFLREGYSLETLTVIFCSDDQLLEINRQFLQHDDYTDIVTFDLSDRKDSTEKGRNLPIVGEIYLSIDRILDNAQKFAVPKTNELYRVLFHGCLHLCGYGDKKAAEKRRMTEKENEYLDLFNSSVPRGTI
jgi:probable rRNA maturation factor